MATASLAVPKSVMKTMVGRVAETVWLVAGGSFVAGGWEQAAHRANIERIAPTIRVRKILLSSHQDGSGGGKQHKIMRRKRTSIPESKVRSGPVPGPRTMWLGLRGPGCVCTKRRTEHAPR